MNKCSCASCPNQVAVKLPVYLNSNQRLMLGYFCKQCILRKCDNEHRQ